MDYIIRFFCHAPQETFLFTSLDFWIFLAFCLAGFSLCYKNRQARNNFLLVCSLFFYYKVCGPFILALLLSVLLNYGIGLAMETASPRGKTRGLVIGIIANLLILFFGKYGPSFIQNLDNPSASGLLSLDYFSPQGFQAAANAGPLPLLQHSIPALSLSFLTLQALSYLIDLKRGNALAFKHPGDFGLYLAFFPRLVAGPLLRARETKTLLQQHYLLGTREFSTALFLILCGLIKKLVFADTLAWHFPEASFSAAETSNSLEKWVELYAFILRVYMDFSGYADMAAGLAALFGFPLPRSFRAPYKAVNSGAFWRSWFVSLSEWFRDYIYIPLGGNRQGKWRQGLALCCTFFLAALWWGGGWGVLLWGVLWGLLASLEKLSGWDKLTKRPVKPGAMPSKLEHGRSGGNPAKARFFWQATGWILTFHSIGLAWILFRMPDLQSAADFFFGLFEPMDGQALPALAGEHGNCIVLMLIGFAGILLPKESQKNWMARRFSQSPLWFQFLLVLLAAALLLLFPDWI